MNKSDETEASKSQISPTPRLTSLDAFRGATMILMASSGFGVSQWIAKQHPGESFWEWTASHLTHAPWVGCTLWDLIQPSFMFMVGVAVPYSLAKRRREGQAFTSLFLHAIARSLILVLLGVFLTSAWSDETQWLFTNVLSQIGLGYPLLFLLAFAQPRWQLAAAIVILVLYWLYFVLHPLPDSSFDWNSVGIPDHWPFQAGFQAHWEKNTNAAAGFDRWFLNLFPRSKPYVFSHGGYQTLNFVPSLATMVFGLLAGEWLKSDRSYRTKVLGMLIVGTAAIVVGVTLAASGLCPIVKRIWTPSWTILSAGYICWILAGFVTIIDWLGYRRWSYPLIVAGLNPITLYCLWQLSGGFVRRMLTVHFGPEFFTQFGDALAPAMERTSVLLIYWAILAWMHWRRIYVRI